MKDYVIYNFIKEHLVSDLNLLIEDTSRNFIRDFVELWNNYKSCSSFAGQQRANAMKDHSKGYGNAFLEDENNQQTRKASFDRECKTTLEELIKRNKVKDPDGARRQLSTFLKGYLANFNDDGTLIGDQGGAAGNIRKEINKIDGDHKRERYNLRQINRDFINYANTHSGRR